MTEGFSSIIKSLEQQKAALDRAIAALREIDGTPPDWVTGPVTKTTRQEISARKGKKRSAAVRKRMREAQQARWKRIKGEAARKSTGRKKS